MSTQYIERSLLDFQRQFATDDLCAKHLAHHRWALGFTCPRCAHPQFWLHAPRHVFECKQCHHQTSVTAGTIFHKTRVPLQKWYWLIYHMAMDKVGVSIAEMQRLLAIGSYRTAWLMAHKVRKAMMDRDAQYTLAGLVELDDAFFGPSSEIRGRGSDQKSTVLCAVSLYTDAKGNDRPGVARLAIVNDVSSHTVEDFLATLGCGVETEEGSQLLHTIKTDGWRSYAKAAKAKQVEHYKVVLRCPQDAGILLPWVHRVMSNVKAVIRGTHRGVSDKHLESYLAEFCYRFNRRFWEKELFDRLVQACISTETIQYQELIKRPRTAKKALRS